MCARIGTKLVLHFYYPSEASLFIGSLSIMGWRSTQNLSLLVKRALSLSRSCAMKCVQEEGGFWHDSASVAINGAFIDENGD